MVKNAPANAGDTGIVGSVPELERSPGGGNCNPLQYSCLENPMDRGAWWVTVGGVAKSPTRLNTSTSMYETVIFLNYIGGGRYPWKEYQTISKRRYSFITFI